MLSRFVCSMANKSTCGVLGIPGGKCCPTPIGATNPGPRTVESGSLMLGFDCTSRCVIVLWLMLRTVRDVNGPTVGVGSPVVGSGSSGTIRESNVPLAKKAAVRALATAPSIA